MRTSSPASTVVSDPALVLPAADADAPRILIVRLSALGDIVFASSMLDALRRRWPRAHIAWLAQGGFAGILDGDPRVDELIRAPAEVLQSPAALWRLRRELRARRFDWTFEVQGLFKSRLVAWLAGGTRVGFRSKEPGAFLMRHLLDKGGDIADIASEYRYFAARVSGLRAGPPHLVVGDARRAAVAARRAELGIADGFVALCPFTTRPQKHWIEDHWPQLVQRLHDAGVGPCVLFGGPGDAEAAARIAAATPVPLIDLTGQTRFAELPAWLAQARLVIGVDTGLTHIGIAVRTPTIALFGSTCPYTKGAESPLLVMYDALPCAPCRRRPTCEGRYDCMRGLTPQRVATAARQLLGVAPPAAP
ncbi:glycosyltransferase family 9 protein [Solimonas soli]|uniref:glycosyltransferase family 9 protein n=1 Tax=Solimonas soli TaxID=413479 RepID=UPI00146FAF32